MTAPMEINWDDLCKMAGPYPLEAFEFVSEGLGFTVEQIESARLEEEWGFVGMEGPHVSGQELCLGLRDFAIKQYGLLAPMVLRHWNVNQTVDFGRIVFAMIDFGLMKKNDSDSIEDFQGVFEFDEAFARDCIIDRISSN